MKIRITKTDIKDGIKQSKDYCPIGLALRRRFDDVAVDREAVMVERAGVVRVLVLPHEAQNFIERFDDGHIVQPFTLRLDLK